LQVSCDWQCYKKTDLTLKESSQQAAVIAAANGKTEVRALTFIILILKDHKDLKQKTAVLDD
jgi:hypothetical protein